MKIIYVNQCFLTYFLIIFHVSKAATHWIVTEDGKVHTHDDSIFQMRRPYDLMSFLQQENRADMFLSIKNQLLMQKEEIESDSFESHDDVEQLIYLTNADCIKAGKPLIQLDLHIGTLVFTYPKSDRRTFPDTFPSKNLHLTSVDTSDNSLHYDPNNKNLIVITSSDTNQIGSVNSQTDSEKATEPAPLSDFDLESNDDKVKFAPNCSEYLSLEFSMSTFEHLPSVRDRKKLEISPEKEIYHQLGKWTSYRAFGKDIRNGLKQNSTSWILYTLASYYWRGLGNADQAIECVRRALHSSPYEYRSIPLLSLATILHRANSFEEAAIVLHSAIEITPDIPHAHYALANIYAILTDYNKSVICFENVLKLCPQFKEAKLRKYAVLCHSNIENALKAQHDTLQKTLDELKDYQRQQELWINHHKKLRAEQAPPNVLLEQRLQYRELKIRQKLDSSIDDQVNGINIGSLPGDVMLPDLLNDFFPNTLPNHLQTKLNSISDKDGKTLLDFYIQLQKPGDETAKDTKEANDKNLDSGDENDDRKNRIKKLLANRVAINNHEEYLRAAAMHLDSLNGIEGDEDCVTEDSTAASTTEEEDGNKSDSNIGGKGSGGGAGGGNGDVESNLLAKQKLLFDSSNNEI